MQFFKSLSVGLLFTLTSVSAGTAASRSVDLSHQPHQHNKITPKVVIISMFTPETETWHHIPEFNLLAHNVSIPGLSPLFPVVQCTKSYEICQVTTGEGEINAASTITALTLSPSFNLTNTYFLIAGIGGISPEVGTTASVTFARFAVQVALQYEIDIRELPRNFSTGYIPQGSEVPAVFPGTVYGTEVFEVNDKLKKIAAGFARNATLADTDLAKAYRAKYRGSKGGIYDLATSEPTVLECDTSTSDVYFSGRLLGEAFANTTKALTGNQGVYCTTQQEDNATLESLLRGAKAGLVDFSRIIIMRSASDFDRPYPGQSATDNLFSEVQGAFEPAIENLYRAGVKIVEGILKGWEDVFEGGVDAGNYLGDALGTLGGKPEFVGGSVVKRGFGGGKRGMRRNRR
ncbi:purine nucleoside permease [Aspergillus crustosus]